MLKVVSVLFTAWTLIACTAETKVVRKVEALERKRVDTVYVVTSPDGRTCEVSKPVPVVNDSVNCYWRSRSSY